MAACRSEAHHGDTFRLQPRALGRKVSDEYMVPVCRLHHRELHRYGDEAASWWAGVNVDPLPIALEFLATLASLRREYAIAVLSSLTAPATNPDNAEQHQIGEMRSRRWPTDRLLEDRLEGRGRDDDKVPKRFLAECVGPNPWRHGENAHDLDDLSRCA